MAILDQARPSTNGRAAGLDAPPLHARLGLSRAQVLELYEIMCLARATDERQWLLNRQGRQAFHISCQGHEGASAGSAFALEPGRDVMVPYYRSLAACLAFGMTPRDVLLASLGKADDPSTSGRQMPAHPGPPRLKILTSGSSVATQIPHASGAALASKIRGDGAVTIVYFGDGATSKGDFHEGLNFAAIHKLPVIFVCENNHLAISVPTQRQMAVASVADRAPGYGMAGVNVDGTDALAVYAAVRDAAARARAGDGPTLVDANVVRITPHSSDDDDRRYRSEGDRAAAKEHDPIRRFRDYLFERDLLDMAGDQSIWERVRASVDQAVLEAEQAPFPEPASAFDQVYADRRMADPKQQLRAGWPR